MVSSSSSPSTSARLTLWENTRDALYQLALTNASIVWDTDIAIEETSKLGAIIGSNFRVAVFVMWYSTAEKRKDA